MQPVKDFHGPHCLRVDEVSERGHFPASAHGQEMNVHQKLRIGLICALILLLGFGIASQRRLQLSIQRDALVAHTHDVIVALDRAADAVHLAASNQRGFLITQSPERARDFHLAQGALGTDLERLRAVAIDNAMQRRRVDHLKLLVEQLLLKQQGYIETARANPKQAVAEYTLAESADAQLMQKIENDLDAMRADVESLRKERTIFSRNASTLAAIFDCAGTLVGIGFVAICALWISRDLRRCEEAEATLNQVREGLEASVQARTADLSATTASLEAEIAERRYTEEQLRDSEQRYRMLFEDSPLPMEVFDPDTLTYLAVNTAACELYGYTHEEFLHMTLLDIRPPDEVTAFKEYLETVKNSDSYSGTFVTRHKNGRTITIEARVRTIQFGGRKARLKLVTDVTEKKRLESHLQQAQKMEAIGRLAGGVAHDFNNLLMVILGYSDSILNKLDDADPIRDKVSEIHAAGQRAANLTSQLLAFSRKQILQMQTVQLNAIVSNIISMLRRLLGEDIQISLDLDDDLGDISADPTQLEQILLNLSVNARDAMPQGGELTIETHNVELNEDDAATKDIAPGKYVQLSVGDTGRGMDEATRSKVFEPFFTTKEVGKGTGLGLSMVLGVVQQTGGAITVDSEVGLGTTFNIYFPRLETPVIAAPEPATTNEIPVVASQGATILLVEDEKQLRTLAREVLKEAGYTVLEASNGKEALRLAETLALPPSLLLTDVVMPEMSGLQLAQELQKKWPGLSIIYTSGYTEHALLRGKSPGEDMPFLQKPYMPGQLLERVAQVLECERCRSVLIVDDDEDVRFQLRSHLERSGYQVWEAANGHQALQQLSSQPVKLVITDLFMPEKDGLELISELRKRRPDIKILALSGAESATFLKLASTLGADVVLPKPFLEEQVTRVAESLLV